MITKKDSSDYYVISKMDIKSRKHYRVKTNIKKKSDAKKEMEKLAKKLGKKISQSGYFEHNGFYYGVQISNKELDSVILK